MSETITFTFQPPGRDLRIGPATIGTIQTEKRIYRVQIKRDGAAWRITIPGAFKLSDDEARRLLRAWQEARRATLVKDQS